MLRSLFSIFRGGGVELKLKSLIREAVSGEALRSLHRRKIILVSETRLMNEETPSKLLTYEWLGRHSEGSRGKLAKTGVEVLTPRTLGQVVCTETGRHYIARKIEMRSTVWVLVSQHTSPRRERHKMEIYLRKSLIC